MTLPPCSSNKRLLSSIASARRPLTPRQMSLAFEPSIIQDLTTSERTRAVTQLASLLLQAAGRPTGEDDDDEL